MQKIGIIMGSDSDLRIMRDAAQTCAQFGVAHEVTIVSAHRTPERLLDYGKSAAARGLRVIIAGAGGAAHLPGMIAAVTPLPVIGVPIHSSNSIDGWDSVLSILQMPAGVPVATVALDGAKNAALLALRILGASDDVLRERLAAYQDEMRASVLAKADALKSEYPCDY
mgnify:FL=1